MVKLVSEFNGTLKIYADNLACSNFDSSRGIAGRGVAMQTTRRDLRNTKLQCCNRLTAIKTTAPTSRQSVSRISDADNGSTTSSEVNIICISRSRGGSCSRGEVGEYGAHATRSLPVATSIATPGRQTDPTTRPISSMPVLQAFLGSEARGIFLSETTLTRSPVSHSRRERCSLQPSLPKPKWRRTREPGHLARPRQQQRRGKKLALDRLPRVLSRSLPVEDQ